MGKPMITQKQTAYCNAKTFAYLEANPSAFEEALTLSVCNDGYLVPASEPAEYFEGMIVSCFAPLIPDNTIVIENPDKSIKVVTLPSE